MRRKKTFKREINPDPKYNDILVTKFINNLMEGGKKSIAQKIFYNALESAAKNLKKDNPIEVLEEAIKNTSPLLEVKSRRVGGANYQVPYEVKGKRRKALAMRWIIRAARKKKGKSMALKLTQELADAYNNTGDAVKKKEDTHKVAEANRAFAHFAW
ncbi:MAG: 30S ribosomal protein S7 [Candidatus Portnoybacteria bacterium CG10_big_fil_rev_8_21_14_0_10_38_18]|uniref:Small ribosomal subunit protein uS7 n=1 Tax=Candidatus Portnoybacteria bacterium CG10_big_fil_rev_8_21_14_0_10_38_18 TaxID=1974813 RepID=A0A2M8KCI5_9BACT|nr:MAG: 30S ribosomal protein S7 [Candidatus Portnoybacteria bacterium CG10_big_fil_rev_8_21_14_0_10_38_18]